MPASSEIRKAVVISDAHLGQRGDDRFGQYSLLSQVSSSPAREQAVRIQHELRTMIRNFAAGDRIRLIAAGDFLDLSLAFLRDASEDLVALIRDVPQIGEILWVVGNHDHHIWSLHENYEHAIKPMLEGKAPEAGSLYRATSPGGVVHVPLTRYVTAQCPHVETVKIAYPVHECLVPGDTGGDLHVYVTHGHLLEGGLYTTLSDLLAKDLDPATVNLPLIEFIYWLLGEAGENAGADGLIEEIYTDLQHGRHDKVDRLLDAAIDMWLPRGVGWLPLRASWEKKVLRWGARKLLAAYLPNVRDRRARARHEDLEKTHERVSPERLEKHTSWRRDQDACLVFGHTHEPDEWTIEGTRTTCYNMGSWLLEPGPEAGPRTIEPRALLLERGMPRIWSCKATYQPVTRQAA